MQNNLSIEGLIGLLRITKKTDPEFKALKKLKQAIEAIGIEAVAQEPTTKIIVFHFGLGNQLDEEFIALTLPSCPYSVIPGQSFCFLNFSKLNEAVNYMTLRKRISLFAFYQLIEFRNLQRLLIFFYSPTQFNLPLLQYSIDSCSSKYIPYSIPGLTLIEDFISTEEEIDISLNLNHYQWEKLNNRRVQHFGYKFHYGLNTINQHEQLNQNIPEFLLPILKRLWEIPEMKGIVFDQLTVNDYFAGDGIPPHFDTHSPFEEEFVSLSLLSGIVMEFKRFDNEEHSVFLRPRSLAIFSGEARYAWTHGISCRKFDKINEEIIHRSRRISLTFRKIKKSPCTCSYYFYCDSQGYNQETMKKKNPLLKKYLHDKNGFEFEKHSPVFIETEFVEKAYNGFGFDFHNRSIEIIVEFLKECEKEEFVIDIGNGNAEYSQYLSHVNYFGVEKCQIMNPGSNQFHMDCLKLCFRKEIADKILFVAVLHHIASEERRLRCLFEIERLLKKNGILYLSVLKYKEEISNKKDLMLDYCLQRHKIRENNVEVQEAKESSKGITYSRYYHCFEKEELEFLMEKTGLKIIEIKEDEENFIIKAIALKLNYLK